MNMPDEIYVRKRGGWMWIMPQKEKETTRYIKAEEEKKNVRNKGISDSRSSILEHNSRTEKRSL